MRNGPHTGLDVPKFGTFARQIAPITSQDLEDCLALQQEIGGRLGEIMVAQGLLGQKDVLEVLRRQAKWAAQMRAGDVSPNSFPLDASLSVVFPCYNEGDVIAGNLDAALVILPEFVHEFEVIVIDDGSEDNTGLTVKTYAETDARVRLVQHPKNRGYGAAVTTGFRAATGELVCLVDGDGQFSLVDLPQLLAAYGPADVVFGYRYDRADTAMRSWNARCWNLLIRSLLGVKIRDLDCAFKLIPRWILEQIELCSDGACISGEIVTQCVHGGVRLAEVPVNHHPRYHGGATGARIDVIGKAFRELPGLWKYRKTPTIERRQPTPLEPHFSSASATANLTNQVQVNALSFDSDKSASSE
jgi:hypothetical protein